MFFFFYFALHPSECGGKLIGGDVAGLPATTLASCCVRAMGVTRRASTMAEAILRACRSSPYARRMEARAC